ncbi:MAG: hypothetical protein R3264_01240, partial [Anaerolineae bacterium]|nr:hypothetical protein [Anaerolineae bacterium]
MSTSQQHHHMHLDKTHPSGAEEWVCPICAQRYLISWSPSFKRTVLETGDENALHSGAKGGLQMGQVQIE